MAFGAEQVAVLIHRHLQAAMAREGLHGLATRTGNSWREASHAVAA